jgi:hypothetical protein
MYKRWQATIKDSDFAPPLTEEDMPRFQRLIREARIGAETVRFPHIEPVGYGYTVQSKPTLIDNLCVRSLAVAEQANIMIPRAIGAYRMRRNDTVNPFRWVIWLWTLPSSIVASMGFDSDAKAVRVIQIIYQAAGVVYLVLEAYFTWFRPVR